MARLVLVGLPGVGKTEVAQLLAAQWGCGALDTDEVLSLEVGCSPGEYLRRFGVEAFRGQELSALRAALASDAVVSTGGGVVSTREARDLLGQETTFWLDCADDELVVRLQDGDRPLLGADRLKGLRKLRRERESWYREVALMKVDASGELAEVAARVLDALGQRCDES